MEQRYLFQPLRFGRQGGLAVTTDADRHLRDKVLAVLFTAPGERLNDPTFGVGLGQAVFEPMDELALAALEYRISEGLRRDVGDEIIIESIDLALRPERGELILDIGFARRSDRVSRKLEVRL